jgi:hypothetical protein
MGHLLAELEGVVEERLEKTAIELDTPRGEKPEGVRGVKHVEDNVSKVSGEVALATKYQYKT